VGDAQERERELEREKQAIEERKENKDQRERRKAAIELDGCLAGTGRIA
jgi:hypothetical protein